MQKTKMVCVKRDLEKADDDETMGENSWRYGE